MQTFIEFLKSSAVGGFFVLLPLLLFAILLGEVLEGVVVLAMPIADLFPQGPLENLQEPVVVAIVLILFASFVLGLATRLAIARRFGAWLESKTWGAFRSTGRSRALRRVSMP
jgi:hypothetical protein